MNSGRKFFLTAKVSEEVNMKYPARNMTVQLLIIIVYTDLSATHRQTDGWTYNTTMPTDDRSYHVQHDQLKHTILWCYLFLSREGFLGERSESIVCFGVLGFLLVRRQEGGAGTDGGRGGRRSFERLDAIFEPITDGWKINLLSSGWLMTASLCHSHGVKFCYYSPNCHFCHSIR